MAKAPTSEIIKLRSARLSFARLWKPKAFQEGQDPRFEATFLLDPSNADHASTIAEIKAAAMKLIKESGLDARAFKLCFGKGDDKPYDGYAGMVYIAANNKTRPTVVDRNRNPVAEGDKQAPYSGCIVNTNLTLWLQNNQYGKRINANLRIVQFVADGPAFGVQAAKAEDEFEALGDAPAGAAAGLDDDLPF